MGKGAPKATSKAKIGYLTMTRHLTYHARDLDAFPCWSFETLDLEYDAESQSMWMSYAEDGPPYYSLQKLQDVGDVRETMRAYFAAGANVENPVRYFIMASKKPGVFNLGGDLTMFSSAIKAGDADLLSLYAHACTELVYGLSTAFDLPMVTLSVISGQALGGGLEGALAEDFVIAEADAKLGVPEIAFNTFPGMGAMSLLSRRLGTGKAERLISSGKIYSGEEMYEEGVIDVLAPAGRVRETALEWMKEGGDEAFQRRMAMARTRRALFPVSQNELDEITDIWVKCSCDITPHDVRYMERLAAAQQRAFG